MSESVFNIFGDHITRQAVKNVARQPLYNIENMGKTVSTGPIKPNEPVKNVGELKKASDPKTKKSFLSNTGKAFQSTPLRQVFTPRSINMGALIYTDNDTKNETGLSLEEVEFTKPSRKGCHELYTFDFFEQPKIQDPSPPNTPPHSIQRSSMEFDCSYQDDFFIDDFSNESAYENDPDFPDLF